MSPRMDGWSIYVISHISGHISTRKCARRLINVIASLSRRVTGIGGVRTLNSRRARRMTMVHRFVLPERTSTSFCRDEWGRIFGDWVLATWLDRPQSIIHLGQSRYNEGIKNRVTITSAVSARDTSDKYNRAGKVYFFRERRSVSIAYAKILPLRT